jgi:hypothetical protein
MQSTSYSCQILMRLELPRHSFEKYSNIKFNENQPNGSRAYLCGRTDGQTERYDEVNNRFSQYCGRAKELHLCLLL